MKIILTVEDLIKRCLWSNYKTYVLKNMSENEVRKFIEENNTVVITEEDAYVIGLLKIVETENLIHRFNVDIDESLKVKSTIHEINGEKKVLVSKPAILKETITFKNRFPECYKPDIVYEKAIKDVIEYTNKLYKDFCALDDIVITIKEKTHTFVYTNEVRKILKKYNAIPMD